MIVRCLSCRTLIRFGSRCAPCARANRAKRGNEQQFRRAVLTRDGLRCQLCGIITTLTPGKPNSAEADHVVAVANGGHSGVTNGRAVCRTCNRKRGAR